MTIQDLGALGELIGSVAVLATLVYLTLQTRQNTRAIGAQLDAALVAARQNRFLPALTSNELVEAIREDNKTDLTTNELRLTNYWWSIITYLSWQHHQARRGLLSTYSEAATAQTVRGLFTNSHGFEGWWEGVEPTFSAEFIEWVEEQRLMAA